MDFNSGKVFSKILQNYFLFYNEWKMLNLSIYGIWKSSKFCLFRSSYEKKIHVKLILRVSTSEHHAERMSNDKQRWRSPAHFHCSRVCVVWVWLFFLIWPTFRTLLRHRTCIGSITNDMMIFYLCNTFVSERWNIFRLDFLFIGC